MAEPQLRPDFPRRLKQARIEAGFSVIDLARRITSTRGEVNAATGKRDSIGASTVRAYEAEETRASITIVKQLSDVLGKPISYFCEGLEAPETATPASAGQLSELSELQAEFKRLKLEHLDLLGKYSQLAKEVEFLKGRA